MLDFPGIMERKFDIALRLSVLASILTSCGTLDNKSIQATQQAHEVNGAIATLEAAGTQIPPPTPTPTETPTRTPTPISGVIITHPDGTREIYPTEVAPSCGGIWGCPGDTREEFLNGTPVPETKKTTPSSWPATLGGLACATSILVPTGVYFGAREVKRRIRASKRKSVIK